MAYRPPTFAESFWLEIERELLKDNVPYQIIRNLEDDFKRAFEISEDVSLEQLYVPGRFKGTTLNLLEPQKFLQEVVKTIQNRLSARQITFYLEDRLTWDRLFKKAWVDEKGRPIFSEEFEKSVRSWAHASDSRIPRSIAEGNLERSMWKEMQRVHAAQMGKLIDPEYQRKLRDLYFVNQTLPILGGAGFWGVGGRPMGEVSKELGRALGRQGRLQETLVNSLEIEREIRAKPTLTPADLTTLKAAQAQVRWTREALTKNLEEWHAKNLLLIPEILELSDRSKKREFPGLKLQVTLYRKDQEKTREDRKDWEKKWGDPGEFAKVSEELKKSGVTQIGRRPIDDVLAEAQAAATQIAGLAGDPAAQERARLAWQVGADAARKEAISKEFESEERRRKALEQSEALGRTQEQWNRLYRNRKLRFQTQNFLEEWDRHGLVPTLVDRGWGALKFKVFGAKPKGRKRVIKGEKESYRDYLLRRGKADFKYGLRVLRYYAYPPNLIEALVEKGMRFTGIPQMLNLWDRANRALAERVKGAGRFVFEKSLSAALAPAKWAGRAVGKALGPAVAKLRKKLAPALGSKAAILIKKQWDKITSRVGMALGGFLGPLGSVAGGVLGFLAGKLIRRIMEEFGWAIKGIAIILVGIFAVFFGLLLFVVIGVLVVIGSIFGVGGTAGVPGAVPPTGAVEITKTACIPTLADCDNPANFANPFTAPNGSYPTVFWRISIRNASPNPIAGASFTDERCKKTEENLGDLDPGEEKLFTCASSESGTNKVVTNTVSFTASSPAFSQIGAGSLVLGSPVVGCYSFSGSWSASERAAVLAAASKLLASSSFTSRLCAGGTIYLERNYTDDPNAVNRAPNPPGNLIILINRAFSSSNNLLFTLAHESGHIYMYRNWPVFGSYCTSVFGLDCATLASDGPPPGSEGYIRTYPGVKSPGEDFAEMIGVYVVWRSGFRWKCCGSINFPVEYPKHYNFAKPTIFGGYEY